MCSLFVFAVRGEAIHAVILVVEICRKRNADRLGKAEPKGRM